MPHPRNSSFHLHRSNFSKSLGALAAKSYAKDRETVSARVPRLSPAFWAMSSPKVAIKFLPLTRSVRYSQKETPSFETLLNQPLAGTLYHSTTQRQTQSNSLLVAFLSARVGFRRQSSLEVKGLANLLHCNPHLLVFKHLIQFA